VTVRGLTRGGQGADRQTRAVPGGKGGVPELRDSGKIGDIQPGDRECVEYE